MGLWGKAKTKQYKLTLHYVGNCNLSFLVSSLWGLPYSRWGNNVSWDSCAMYQFTAATVGIKTSAKVYHV